MANVFFRTILRHQLDRFVGDDHVNDFHLVPFKIHFKIELFFVLFYILSSTEAFRINFFVNETFLFLHFSVWFAIAMVSVTVNS